MGSYHFSHIVYLRATPTAGQALAAILPPHYTFVPTVGAGRVRLPAPLPPPPLLEVAADSLRPADGILAELGGIEIGPYEPIFRDRCWPRLEGDGFSGAGRTRVRC